MPLRSDEERETRETVAQVLKEGMSAASIVINNRCNLKCKHCYIYEPERQTRGLSQFYRKIDPKSFDLTTALGIAQDLRGLVYLVTMPAMEPFLSRESTDTALSVAQASSERAAVSVITNGTTAPLWLDEKRVKTLTDSVEFLSVSLEGGKKLHDNIRGEGNFDRAIKGIDHIINLGYSGERITFQTCIQPLLQDPYQQAFDIMELAEEFGVGKASFTAYISPSLSSEPTREDVSIHQTVFNEIIRALKKTEERSIKKKLITLYGTYESPAAVVALNREIRDLREKSPQIVTEFNTFETSYYVKHPEFKTFDVRLEVAPLSIEIPCYPRIAASNNFLKLINIKDTDHPYFQEAYITRCFAYQVDETPIAHWMPGLFPHIEKRLVQEGENLARTLPIPSATDIIAVNPEEPRTKQEYFEEVLKESIKYTLQKTVFLKQTYNRLNGE